jgi:hypothetical protein
MSFYEFILMLSGAALWTAGVCLGVMWLIHTYLGDRDE